MNYKSQRTLKKHSCSELLGINSIHTDETRQNKHELIWDTIFVITLRRR